MLLGEEERKAGTVTVKDLAARKNHGGLSPEEAIKLVRELTKKERN